MTREKVPPFDNAELRRQAETQLEKNRNSPPAPETEEKRLHHELQVHQVELELQNAELRQTRDELETTLRKYTDLYDFAPVGYFTLDHIGTIRSVNLTGACFVGVERSQLVGRRFGLFVTDEARPDFNAFLGKVFTSLDKESCEMALLREGKYPIFVQAEALTAESGQECLIALMDITKRKQAEGSLQRVEEEAAKALQTVTEAADKALRIVKEAEAEADVEAETEAARLKVAEATEAARLLVAEAGEKAYLIMGDIEQFPKLQEATYVARLKVAAAAVAACMKVAEAASERRKLKTTSNQLLLAKAATASKSQFLANMSHELRTPMTGVLGMLDLVLLGNLDAEQREFIEISRRSALALIRILNDILDLTRIEAGKLSIEEKPFSVRKCVENTCNILFPVVKSKGIDLDCMVADDVPETLVGDQTRINQVLTNLAGNAVKFTQKGKVALRVTTVGSTPGSKREVTFTISDSGIGIPDDKKKLLFHAFSQVDDSHSRSYGGTGLGLVISKEIVERMGGTITFTSEERIGSTFSFTLPLAEAPRGSKAQLAAKPQSTDTKSPTPAGERIPRLLLAEDDPTIRALLGLLFKRSHYNIDFAEDGRKAVEMWEQGGYDLVLMDVQMPQLNGFEATSIIRDQEQAKGSHTPIVAMTAHAGKEDEDRCLAAGMDAYISKPIDFQKSLQVIGNIIKQKSNV